METETRSTLGDEIALVKERYDGGETTWTPVGDEFVDNFLGAVPPIYFDGGFACGEEYDWRAGGKTYFCVVDNMARICTIQDAKDFAARRKALPNLNPARVQYLLDYASKHYGSLPFAFPREFELGGGILVEDGITTSEDEAIKAKWRTMSGGSCYMDALRSFAGQKCECCQHYDRPGNIYNAGAWMRCPMCNPSFVR